MIAPQAIAYWQIMAAAKWATIAVLQGDRFRKGGEERLELAGAVTEAVAGEVRAAGGAGGRGGRGG